MTDAYGLLHAHRRELVKTARPRRLLMRVGWIGFAGRAIAGPPDLKAIVFEEDGTKP
jgi:hypothetical protein